MFPRKPMLPDTAVLANKVHPVHRGGKLPENIRRGALEKVAGLTGKLKVEAHPSVNFSRS